MELPGLTTGKKLPLSSYFLTVFSLSFVVCFFGFLLEVSPLPATLKPSGLKNLALFKKIEQVPEILMIAGGGGTSSEESSKDSGGGARPSKEARRQQAESRSKEIIRREEQRKQQREIEEERESRKQEYQFSSSQSASACAVHAGDAGHAKNCDAAVSAGIQQGDPCKFCECNASGQCTGVKWEDLWQGTGGLSVDQILLLGAGAITSSSHVVEACSSHAGAKEHFDNCTKVVAWATGNLIDIREVCETSDPVHCTAIKWDKFWSLSGGQTDKILNPPSSPEPSPPISQEKSQAIIKEAAKQALETQPKVYQPTTETPTTQEPVEEIQKEAAAEEAAQKEMTKKVTLFGKVLQRSKTLFIDSLLGEKPETPAKQPMPLAKIQKTGEEQARQTFRNLELDFAQREKEERLAKIAEDREEKRIEQIQREQAAEKLATELKERGELAQGIRPEQTKTYRPVGPSSQELTKTKETTEPSEPSTALEISRERTREGFRKLAAATHEKQPTSIQQPSEPSSGFGAIVARTQWRSPTEEIGGGAYYTPETVTQANQALISNLERKGIKKDTEIKVEDKEWKVVGVNVYQTSEGKPAEVGVLLEDKDGKKQYYQGAELLVKNPIIEKPAEKPPTRPIPPTKPTEAAESQPTGFFGGIRKFVTNIIPFKPKLETPIPIIGPITDWAEAEKKDRAIKEAAKLYQQGKELTIGTRVGDFSLAEEEIDKAKEIALSNALEEAVASGINLQVGAPLSNLPGYYLTQRDIEEIEKIKKRKQYEQERLKDEKELAREKALEKSLKETVVVQEPFVKRILEGLGLARKPALQPPQPVTPPTETGGGAYGIPTVEERQAAEKRPLFKGDYLGFIGSLREKIGLGPITPESQPEVKPGVDYGGQRMVDVSSRYTQAELDLAKAIKEYDELKTQAEANPQDKELQQKLHSATGAVEGAREKVVSAALEVERWGELLHWENIEAAKKRVEEAKTPNLLTKIANRVGVKLNTEDFKEYREHAIQRAASLLSIPSVGSQIPGEIPYYVTAEDWQIISNLRAERERTGMLYVKDPKLRELINKGVLKLFKIRDIDRDGDREDIWILDYAENANRYGAKFYDIYGQFVAEDRIFLDINKDGKPDTVYHFKDGKFVMLPQLDATCFSHSFMGAFSDLQGGNLIINPFVFMEIWDVSKEEIWDIKRELEKGLAMKKVYGGYDPETDTWQNKPRWQKAVLADTFNGYLVGELYSDEVKGYFADIWNLSIEPVKIAHGPGNLVSPTTTEIKGGFLKDYWDDLVRIYPTKGKGAELRITIPSSKALHLYGDYIEKQYLENQSINSYFIIAMQSQISMRHAYLVLGLEENNGKKYFNVISGRLGLESGWGYYEGKLLRKDDGSLLIPLDEIGRWDPELIKISDIFSPPRIPELPSPQPSGTEIPSETLKPDETPPPAGWGQAAGEGSNPAKAEQLVAGSSGVSDSTKDGSQTMPLPKLTLEGGWGYVIYESDGTKHHFYPEGTDTIKVVDPESGETLGYVKVR